MMNLMMSLLSISETFSLPSAIGEVTPVQWVIVFLVSIFLLLIVIKIWQKLVMFLLKLVALAFVGLVVYLLVVGW